MAGIHIRELYFRVTSRPEILPAELRSALVDAGVHVCRDTNLLRGTTFATLAQGSYSLAIPLPPNQTLNRVDQVFVRDGSEWRKLSELAPVYLEEGPIHASSESPDEPTCWGLRGTLLKFQAPADAPYPMRIDYTWAPTRASQPEVFDLPGEAEEALVAYARWILLRDRDPRLAEMARREYLNALPGLRAMGETGESGTRSIFDFLPFEG